MLGRLTRILAVSGLLTLTVAVFNPGLLFGSSDCWDGCVEEFGECKACTGEWEGYNGILDRCSGTTCYYVCGSACEIGGGGG